MKDLPYFRWYPADANTDEKYASMTDQELGFYHRCLNYAWANNGLPADHEELARLMHVSASFKRLWAKVGQCFYERDGRLFNKRQERERERALEVSEKNKRVGNANASRKKREREKNAPIRAYDSDSVSDFASVSKKKTSLREIPKPWPADFNFEAWFAERDRKHPLPGMPQLAKSYAMDKVFKAFTPAEFDRAHDAWCEYWKTQTSGVPNLATFIEQDWYRKMPREPPKSRAQLSTEEWGTC